MNYGNHLAQVTRQVGFADAFAGFCQRNRLAVRRQARAVIDVVHAFEAGVLQRVDFQDDLVGLVEPGLVVADRRRRNQAAIGQDANDLNHRHIELAQKAEPDKLRHVGQVHVGVLHVAGVDLAAAGRVGLVGQAHVDAVDLGQRAVEFGRGRGTRPQADAKFFAGGMQLFDAPGQRLRHRLGVARAGKAAHADMGTRRNQGGGGIGRHDFGVQVKVLDAIDEGHQG